MYQDKLKYLIASIWCKRKVPGDRELGGREVGDRDLRRRRTKVADSI